VPPIILSAADSKSGGSETAYPKLELGNVIVPSAPIGVTLANRDQWELVPA